MDQRNLFFECEAGKQIFDARLDRLGGIQIKRALLRAGVPGTGGQNRGGKQRHGTMLDFGHETHNFLLVKFLPNPSVANRRDRQARSLRRILYQ